MIFLRFDLSDGQYTYIGCLIGFLYVDYIRTKFNFVKQILMCINEFQLVLIILSCNALFESFEKQMQTVYCMTQYFSVNCLYIIIVIDSAVQSHCVTLYIYNITVLFKYELRLLCIHEASTIEVQPKIDILFICYSICGILRCYVRPKTVFSTTNNLSNCDDLNSYGFIIRSCFVPYHIFALVDIIISRPK